MDINLERADILQLDPISNTGTTKLLPLGKSRKQKLIIGDDSGSVGCYEFKKGEPQTVFSVRPFEGPITCIALGGNPLKRDKIFASHSQRIVGVTKKGKDFFKLTSSLTETIQNIVIEDTRIWTGCEYIFNLYDNDKDHSFYMSRDHINSLIIDRVSKDSDFDTILGCQDNCIRVIQGSQLGVEIPTSNSTTAVASMHGNDTAKIRKGPSNILYGMDNGALGAVQIQSNLKYNYLWSVEDDLKKSAITCVQAFDLTKDGKNEIIVGRDDGRIEVYSQENVMATPKLSFSKNVGESVRSTDCGLVNSDSFNEIIVAAYSGKIIGYTSEPVLQRAQEDTYGRSVKTVNNENRIKYLKKELEALKKNVEKEREKLKKSAPSSNLSNNIPSAQNDFPINTRFLLDSNLAAYVLTIEIQSAMDLVIIRSPVALDLVESEIGSSVVSITPAHFLSPQENANNDNTHKFVAAFRCQGTERRMSITLRSTEGDYGDLIVTVVTASVPKAAKIIKFPLKPLSLHTRVHEFTNEEQQRPRNKLFFTGNASLSILHEWTQALFPDIPPRLNDDVLETNYLFKNSFTGSTTLCSFKKNELIFESECASTIAIIKETVTRLANYRRVLVEETFVPNDQSLHSFLSLVKPKLEYQLSLTRKMDLLESILEITMQESTKEWLQPEYLDILANQETIRKEFKSKAKNLEYLSGIITDLYVDWNKLIGFDSRHKLPELFSLLQSSSFQEIEKFVLLGIK